MKDLLSLPRRSTPAPATERVIEFTWRIAVIVALVSELLTAALQTHWGERNVPALMVRLGVFQARQVSSILDLVHPPGADAVRSLERAIAKTVSEGRPMVFVWVEKPSNIPAAQLAYGIYPRKFVQPGSAEGMRDNVCRVAWPSGSDVTLSCPGSVWRYGGKDGTSR